MQKINTFVVPIIIPHYIERFLETLYAHTPPNFNLILIDQTKDGIAKYSNDSRVTIYLRPSKNLGFAHAMNTGIRISNTEYVTCANDDVEFIDIRWWDGIMQTFMADKQIKAVNPMSIAEPGWGYGCNRNSDESLVREKEQVLNCKFNREHERFEHLPYKEKYTPQEYDYLLSRKNGYIDGIITWMTVYERKALEYKGLYDERFFPGGGEDYDIGGRFYSQWWPTGVANPTDRYRMVATSRSWAWHHLNKSRTTKDEYLSSDRRNFSDDHAMWEDRWTHPTLAKFRKDGVYRHTL